MTTLPNLQIELPTLGADNGVWDDKINAGFGRVDAHDHTGSGKGIKIATGALNINADVPMGGFGFTALSKLSFSTIALPTTGSKNLFVSSTDNELYWRTNAGVNVKLTNGSSINTTLVGGIVGDYSTVGAEVAYDDANDRYTFKQQGAKPWARIASGPVRIYEFNTTESVYIELAVAAALASSYTVTLPAALPGVGSLMQIDAAGAVTYSLTLPTNTVIRHATTGLAGDFLSSYASTGITISIFSDSPYAQIAASATGWFPIRGLRAGDRLQTLTFHCVYGGTPTISLLKSNGIAVSTAVVATSASAAPPVSDITLTLTVPTALVANEAYTLKMVNSAGGTVQLYGWYATFDRP